MLDHAEIHELIAQIRRLLEERGEVGKFLLRAIDDALGYGIEEVEHVEAPQRKTRRGVSIEFLPGLEESQRSDKALAKKFRPVTSVAVRTPADLEVLSIHLDVIEAHIHVLPACFESAEQDLRHRGIAGVKLTLAREAAPESPAIDQELYSPQEMFPDGWKINAKLIGRIRELLSQRATEQSDEADDT
jgi:hypothetical protein